MIGVMCDSKEMRECFYDAIRIVQFDGLSRISAYSADVYAEVFIGRPSQTGRPSQSRMSKIEAIICRDPSTELINKISGLIPVFRVRILT